MVYTDHPSWPLGASHFLLYWRGYYVAGRLSFPFIYPKIIPRNEW